MVLSFRPSLRGDTHSHPRPVLAAQPGAAQRWSVEGLLRERVGERAGQGGLWLDRSFFVYVYLALRPADFVPPDPDERALRRPLLRDRGHTLGRLPDLSADLDPARPPYEPLLGEEPHEDGVRTLCDRPRYCRFYPQPAPSHTSRCPVRCGAGDQSPQRLLTPERPRPLREPRSLHGHQRHVPARGPDDRPAPYGLYCRNTRPYGGLPHRRRTRDLGLRSRPRSGSLGKASGIRIFPKTE